MYFYPGIVNETFSVFGCKKIINYQMSTYLAKMCYTKNYFKSILPLHIPIILIFSIAIPIIFIINLRV